MSTPRDFMARVVAWPGDNEPGYVNLHYLPPQKAGDKKPGMRGRAYRSLDNFMGMAEWCARKPNLVAHTYFALATQAVCGKEIHGHKLAHRSAETSLKLKAIWLDVDVGPGKGYPTAGLALGDLGAFIAAAQLPHPSAIVASGSGLHIYWFSDRPLTVAEWRPYAEGLKAEAIKHGLKCDAGLTTDAARVLRVPGTTNGKTTPPKAVTIKHLGEDYDFKVPLGRLASVGAGAASVTAPVTKAATFDLSGWGPPAEAFAGLQDNLTAGLRDTTPLDPAEVFRNCPHFFKIASQTHGAGEQQGVWMLDVLACTFLKDGEQWAHHVSKGYSAYSRDETQAMYERKLADKQGGMGWPSCKSFFDQGCKECATCPFKINGLIKSPLNLATREKPKVASVAPPGAGFSVSGPLPALSSEWQNLPEAFTVYNNRICKLSQKKNGEDELLPLFRSELRNFVPWRGEGNKSGLSFDVKIDGGEWLSVFVSEGLLQHNKSELYGWLGDHRVLLHHQNKVWIEDFMSSFLEKMNEAGRRMETIPFGWFMDGSGGKPTGFAYGGKLFLTDGTERSAGYADSATQHTYSPQGQPEPWQKAIRLITDQNRPGIETIVAMSFGAPLMQIMGLANGALVFRSAQGGAHKTTALSVGLAVWGSPQKAKEIIDTTQNSLMGRLGTLKNLPLYLDEINNQDKFGGVEKFLNQSTEGVDKGRMKANLEQQVKKTWQTLVGLGTNADFWAYLKRGHKNSDAIFHRVFQYEVLPVPGKANQREVDQLISSLNYNCGHAGLVYAKYLATNYDRVYQFTSDLRDKFGASVKCRDPERFRAAQVATMIAGAAFANDCLNAGFHLDELFNFLRQEFLRCRTEIDQMSLIAGSKEHISQIMDRFFVLYGGNTVWMKGMPMGPGKPTLATLLHGPQRDDSQIFIRCDVDNREIVFKKDVFEEFCASNKFDECFRALKQVYGAKTARGTVAKATRFPVGTAVSVIVLPVKPDGPFADHLYSHTPDNERPQSTAPTNTLPMPLSGLDMAAVPMSPTGLTGASAPA